jgi:hypothetical protein
VQLAGGRFVSIHNGDLLDRLAPRWLLVYVRAGDAVGVSRTLRACEGSSPTDHRDGPEALSAMGAPASAAAIPTVECPVVGVVWAGDAVGASCSLWVCEGACRRSPANHRDGPEALSTMGAPWAIPTAECPVVASHPWRRRPARGLRAGERGALLRRRLGVRQAAGESVRGLGFGGPEGERATRADCPRAGSVPSWTHAVARTSSCVRACAALGVSYWYRAV